ncbi:MAG TPA: nucleoside deaminase [Candidatus Borkfalkia excrementipullorum]|nr:nucleoside deaminase [Candidatus Borkfalkia excrementipullorum]
MEDKIKFMKEALKRAKKGLAQGEVPVGAVIVHEGKVVSSGYNRRTRTQTAISHAEIYAIDRACKKFGSWRLPECDLYVTLEPCPMCMGAALNARVRKIYFGAYEQKGRSMTGELAASNLLNHTLEVEGGVLEEECSEVLSGFFRSMRARTKQGAAAPAADAANEGEPQS